MFKEDGIEDALYILEKTALGTMGEEVWEKKCVSKGPAEVMMLSFSRPNVSMLKGI